MLLLLILPMPVFGAESSQQPFGKHQYSDQLKVAATSLENTHWKLIELNGKSLILKKKQREPYMILRPEKHGITGFAGCNRMMGSYKVAGEEITFSKIGSTRMACQSGMDIEYDFLKSLGSANFYKIKRDSLELFDDNHQILTRFVAQELTSSKPDPIKTFVYDCTDGYHFVARIEGKKAWLFLPGKTINLPYVPAASGVKYSDGSNIYHTKGEEALLIYDDSMHKGCLNNRKAAIWEHAKLNGVDFRAVGNEPPWILEIIGNGKIHVITDYGNNVFIFDTPKPVINHEQNMTTYNARAGEHSLKIVLSAERCEDTMSDETYETSVTLWLNGKKFTGCGRPLH